jgi:hypothetical protein
MSNIISKALNRLETKKPMFHSESHLSEWLADTLKKMVDLPSWPKLQMAGFYRVNKKLRLDMLFVHRGREYAVELKYTRAPMNKGNPLSYRGDVFYAPKSGSPDDITRFNFLRDIERLESEIPIRENSVGFVLLMTNRRALWEKGDRTANDAAFHIDDGIRRGLLEWASPPSPNTVERAGESLWIENNYDTKWRTYSDIPKLKKNGLFRYLLLKVVG